jgi:hypothetical protein
MLQNANGITAAMRPHSTSAATSMTSGTAIDEANVGQLAEVDARLNRTLDHPATAPRCQRCRCGNGYVARC